MIVIIKDRYGDEIFHEDVAAVVRNRAGFLLLCRDGGKPDEYIDDSAVVTVVNDG